MTYIVFYNKNGNKKLAVELDEKTSIQNMTAGLSKLINGLCNRNQYTFSYKNIDDSAGLKNLPILTIASCL